MPKPRILRAVYALVVHDSDGDVHDAHIYVRRDDTSPRGFRIAFVADGHTVTTITLLNREEQAIEEAIASVWPHQTPT